MPISNAHKLKILIIEDSLDQVEIIRQRLIISTIAHEVQHFESGEDGIQYLDSLIAQQDPLPDIIILDIKLPGINGLEVLRRLQSRPDMKDTPVIILSVSEDLQDVVKTYKLGGTFFMKKPFDQAVFHQVIDQLKVTGRIKVPFK